MDTIMTFGGFVPLPFILYAVIQTVRKRPQVTLFGVLLAYLGVLIPVGIFAWGTARQTLPSLLTLALTASAGISFVFGLVLLGVQLRSQQRMISRSYGLLGMGVSALLVVGVLVTPTILSLIPNATATATQVSGGLPFTAAGQNAGAQTRLTSSDSGTQSDTSAQTSSLPAAPAGFEAPAGFVLPGAEAAEADAQTEASPSELPAASLPAGAAASDENTAAQVEATEIPATQRQAVLPTITPTLAITPTPLATATPIPPTCDLLVLYNLNLRAEPDANAELLLTIPYSTVIEADAVNDDGWWHVRYNGQTGWVNGEYVSTMTTCELL